MKRILIAASALAIAGAATLTPANAQIGVQVGPFGAGIGPYWGDRYYHTYDYVPYHTYDYVPGECRLIRERVVTPSGNVIFRSRRVCD